MNKRSVLIWDSNTNNWNVNSEFEDIQKDDMFVLIEPDGEIVKDNYGVYKFIAKEDCYIDNDTKEYKVDIFEGGQ